MKLPHFVLAFSAVACTRPPDPGGLDSERRIGVAELAELQTLMRSRGDTVLTIATGPPDLHAVLGRGRDSTFTISYWQTAAGSIRSFATADSLESFPPSSFRWVEYSPSKWMFYVALDYVSAAVIGAVVYQVTGTGLERIFSDSAVCRSSEFIRDDRTGSWVLLTYGSGPSDRDCMSKCYEALQSHYKFEPGPLTAQRWTGRSWQRLPGPDIPVVARQKALSLQAARELATSPWAADCRAEGYTESVLRSWAR